MTARVFAGALLVAAAVIYLWQLDRVPTYISPDEAIIAVDAHALATTGRDVHGTLLPLYFRIENTGQQRSGWFTPAIFYLSAAFYQVLPFAEWSVRVPTVCVGLLNLVLVYLLATRLLRSAWFGMGAATLLALSPAHFIFSRYALDYLYPVPFLLAWLLCLERALSERSPRWLLGAAFCLGLGFYSYAAAVVLVPVFLLVTGLTWFAQHGSWRPVTWATLGFVVVLLPFAVWFVTHPSAFGDTAQRYALYDSRQQNALQGVKELLAFPNVERMTSLYWSFFNPSFLFLAGDQSMTFSTRGAGVFPLVLAVLIPLGAYRMLAVERTPFNLLLLVGFIIAPMPAVLVPEAGAANRATAMLPFGVLIAGFGLKHLWSLATIRFAQPSARAVGAAAIALGLAYGGWTLWSEQRLSGSAAALFALGLALSGFAIQAGRARQGPLLASGLLAVALFQFGGFAQDYFGDYRIRLNSWLGGNLRGALEAIIERRPAGAPSRVYFAHLQSAGGLADIRNYWMETYWRFYLIKHGRTDLLPRSAPFDPQAVAELEPGSFVLGNLDDQVVGSLIAAGQLKTVVTIPELDRDPFFVVLERPGS